jgi:hypothetical protein
LMVSNALLISKPVINTSRFGYSITLAMIKRCAHMMSVVDRW